MASPNPTEQHPSNEMDLLTFAFSNPKSTDPSKPIYLDALDPSRSLTSAQVRRLVQCLIAGLKAQDLQPGDCVLLQMDNNVIYSALFSAIVGAQGVYLGCEANKPAHELANLFQVANPQLVITTGGAISTTLQVCNEHGSPPNRFFTLDDESITNIIHFAQFPTKSNQPDPPIPAQSSKPNMSKIETLLHHGESPWTTFTTPHQSKSTPAAMFLTSGTSGTSGLPKAAIRSHHSFIARHQSAHYPVPYPVIRLMPLPLYHAFGETWAHIFAIRYNEPIYILPRFEIASFLNAVRQCRITETYMVPAMLHVLNRATNASVAESLASLRYVGISGAPLDDVSLQKFQGLLAPEAVAANLFGMTECGMIFQQRYGEVLRPGSSGRLVSGLEVRFVDPDTGRDVEGRVDSPGELWVRGPGLLLGYKGCASPKDEEGWYRTGDMVYAHDDGSHFIIGRVKDLIKVRGWSVAPAEIEAVLLTDPRIKEAIVIGVPLPDGSSETPRAYITKSDSQPAIRMEDVSSLVQSRLAPYKALEGGIIFVDEIPKTGTGKHHRTRLVQLDRQREKLASLLRDVIPAF